MRRVFSLAGWLVYWLGWPFWHKLLAHTDRARVLVIHDDQILLERSFIGSGAWNLPGGGMRADEQPVEAAVRELREETKLALSPSNLIPLGDKMVKNHGISYHAYYFLSEINETRVSQPMNIEIAELRWVAVSDITKVRTLASVGQALDLWRSK